MVSVMATCAHTTHIDTISSSFSYSSSSIVGEHFSLSQSSQSVISFGRLPPSLCTSKKAPISTSSSSSLSAFRPDKEVAKSTSVDELHASFPVRSIRVAATAEQLFADINSIPSKGKPNLSFSLKSEPDSDDIINPRSDSEGLDISQIGLKDELAQSLLSRGIAKLFPIQAAVFKPAMEGRDIIGRAKTGTGKTLAFGIPIIQRLLDEDDEGSRMSRRFRSPRALLVAPTRELALQVEKEFVQTVPNLSIICVYGGVPISSQQRKLLRGVDVAVGTPGRIIDLIERGSLDLRNVKFVVLDEADQMLAVGFEEEVERILEELPPSRQSMLFSATIPIWVKKVSRKFLNNPLTIDLVGESDDKLPEGIKLYAVSMAASAKRSVLNDVITVYGKGGKTIVFTQTKRDADDIALSLSRMHGCEALHGDILQSQREKTLNAFRNGNFSVLVATDVAARGLDIPNVDLVIHFEIPNNPETFVHRSGRTGRAGKEGIAILMHTPGQQRTVKMIERDTGCSLERVGPPSVHDVLNASSEHAEEALKKVHPDLKSMFLKTAEKLIQEQGAYALAAAIAHLSGYTQPPPPRSLITHEQGFITLQVTRNRGPPLLSARRVMGALGDIYTEAVDNIGKIIITDEKDVSGAVFDLPEDLARQLITKNNEVGSEAGLEIEVCTKLPRLMDDGPTSDMYGRFSSRSGGRDRGQRGYGSGKFSDGMDDEFNRNGRDKRFSRGRPENSEGRFNGRRSYSEGPFSGDCFICGESGHKASFCPKGRSASRRSY